MAETKEYIAEVASRTKLARKEAGFKTQADMATKLGIDRARYAKFETERMIAGELIYPFCRATGITERWLLSGEGDMKEDDEFNRVLNQINDDSIRAELQALALRRILEKKET